MSRDVLQPPLMSMEPNRCYRVNLIHDDFTNQRDQQQNRSIDKTYAEKDLYGEDYNDELDNDEVECQIEDTSSGMLKLAMHVAPSFYGGIIGQKGSTKRRIESETQCDISIPPRNVTQNSANSKIVICGDTRNNVLSARGKIQQLVASLRKRMSPTHFYGIALNFGIVKERFIDFKKEIIAAEIPSVDESLFQNENCVHLTFGVCVLMDDIERTTGVEILQSCRELLNDLKYPFTVKVSGLEIMNDDPSSTRVLYAQVESDDLQEFANRCFHRFNQSGLCSDKFNRECVKLHMTIMNSRYSTSKVTSFDAREILKRWGNFDFGTVSCNELMLCVMNDSTSDKNNFYKITGSLKF